MGNSYTSITQEETADLTKKSNLDEREVKQLYRQFRRHADSINGVGSAEELFSLLQKMDVWSDVLDFATSWTGSSRRSQTEGAGGDAPDPVPNNMPTKPRSRRDSITKSTFRRKSATEEQWVKDAESKKMISTILFRALDKDGNGSIDFAELVLGLSCLCRGTREDRARLQFRARDVNGDGTLQEEEIAEAAQLLIMSFWVGSQVSFEMKRPLFRTCGMTDADVTEMIENLHAAIDTQQLSNDLVKLIMTHVDADGDGGITEEEYLQFASSGQFEDFLEGMRSAYDKAGKRGHKWSTRA